MRDVYVTAPPAAFYPVGIFDIDRDSTTNGAVYPSQNTQRRDYGLPTSGAIFSAVVRVCFTLLPEYPSGMHEP